MVGTKFYKPLELDKLTRTVVHTVEREVQERVPVFDDYGIIIDYKMVTKTVTEEVPEQEEYDNPAPNTISRYCEVAQWCNDNRAYIEDKGDYYEVVAIPEPTSEELAAAALAQAKAERAALVEKATVTVDGMTFDADETSQNRLSRGITAALALGLGLPHPNLNGRRPQQMPDVGEANVHPRRNRNPLVVIHPAK